MDETQLEDLCLPDVYRVSAKGNSIPGLKAAALDAALEFYGPEARLQVIGVRDVAQRTLPDECGHSMAMVYVRCLNLPGEDRV